MKDRALRRLTAEQFAFARAVLQGMSLRDAADRYLEPGIDLRLARAEWQALRDELLATARRAHAYGNARILQLDMASLPVGAASSSGSDRPTLETFRDSVDPDGFYGEAELLALYAEQYPPVTSNRRAARLARLRNRQRRALDELEQVLVRPPNPRDPPSSWLEPRLAARLEAVGLKTLQALAERINLHGHGWWTPIPKFGAARAARVAQWFDRNGSAIGLNLSPQSQATPRQRKAAWRALALVPIYRSGIVPLERLSVPANLDGRDGTNRGQGALLESTNDYEAIQAWLDARAGDNVHTRRAYVREAERLLLWGIFERRKALSSLSVDDAIAYRAFLFNPAPAERWVALKAAPRLSPTWRPFTGALSARSVQYAMTVLRSLFDWLVQQRYLVASPIAALPRMKAQAAAADADADQLPLDADRYFTLAQWSVVRRTLKALPDDERGARQRFLVSLAYATGLRQAELVDARIGRLKAELVEQEGVEQRVVTLRVLGKGGKVRSVPFVSELEALLDAYLDIRGLARWQDCQQQGKGSVRLIAPLTSRARTLDSGLSGKQIYREVLDVFYRASDLMTRQGMTADAEQFRRGSTHWLRHTFGRHAMSDGVPPNVVQAVMGHVSLQTTTSYSAQGGTEAFAQLQRLAKKRL